MNTRFPSAPVRPLPAVAGIGLRAEHYDVVLREQPALGWVEVHSENYFGSGGRPLAVLEAIRARHPLSLHGVGLSLGSTDPLDRGHLRQLKALCDRFEPALVSEHLSWGSVGGVHANDLLPLPCTTEALNHVCARVATVQDALGRTLLVENISRYVDFRIPSLPEGEFLATLARRTGCGLLLDVNNLYVNARNHGVDPHAFLAALPPAAIAEIHLAGHTEKTLRGTSLLIDTHDRPVCPAVWTLYAEAIARFGPRPTLIEWDSALPPLDVLLAEAARADAVLEGRRHAA
ncbi:hypothetical protein EV699_11353 [Plasticicumulans lactativorans]|uniref:UPF0276 protein EV699_11353 n=1 Tax=Plasticicumulans lactativorans TaxID=1133106 RepID=A0A4R2LM97_9GAMM|nr:DUF692 domain-containing protein [Plasticicumulans lactativorans]TCO80575.1 hypothetical protein EV699_11353 [Plasticicumulans lactativorans]